jgi:cell division protein FtsB
VRWLAFALFVALVMTQTELWSARSGLPGVLALQRQIDAQMRENATLRERNLALDAEVQDLKQGLEAVEERARSEMGMIRENEIFYQIVDMPATSALADRLTADTRK